MGDVERFVESMNVGKPQLVRDLLVRYMASPAGRSRVAGIFHRQAPPLTAGLRGAEGVKLKVFVTQSDAMLTRIKLFFACVPRGELGGAEYRELRAILADLEEARRLTS